MAPVKLFIATSADGYIARKDGGIDWLFSDQDYGYTPFFASVDALIMGSKTYEQSLSFGAWPYPGVSSYVFTRRGLRPPPGQPVQFVSGAAGLILDQVRAVAKKAIWLVGGGAVVSQFRQAGLIDEYEIFVHPVLLGDGIPLFAAGLPQEDLRLAQTRSYASGLVQLHYVKARDE